MLNSIENYVKHLRAALKGQDSALVQDALWDAETHLRASLKGIQSDHPDMSEQQAMETLVDTFGSPEEVAEAYIETEQTKNYTVWEKATETKPTEPEKPLPPWPGFFAVLKTPKAYTSLLYLLITLPVGAFFFSLALGGLIISAISTFIVLGIPIAIAFLGTVRIIALVEGRFVEALLDVRMPRRPTILPQGNGVFQKLKNLLLDGHTWATIAYMLMLFPFGVFYFFTMIAGLIAAIAPLALPLAYLFGNATISIGIPGIVLAPWMLVIAPMLGTLILILTLHLALALGRLQGLLAKYMLVRG